VRVATRNCIFLLLSYGQRVKDDAGKQRFAKDYLPLLSKVLGTVFGLVGLIAVLHHFGQDVSSVVAALGIGGLAVSLAAKDTLTNMFAGFAILVDRPFRPGDRIKLATGEIGDVLDVGTRATRVRLLDENMLIVPNNELVNSRVINYNFPSNATRGSLEIDIAYGSDIDQAKAIIKGAIGAQPEIVGSPSVFLGAFVESAMRVVASFVIADFADVQAVQDRIRVRVYNDLRQAQVKIATPPRDQIQVGAPPAPKT